MQVFYRDKFIKEVGSEEEAKEFIKSFKRKNNDYYKPMIDEAHELEEIFPTLRPVHITESFEEYNDFVKTTYPDLFSRLEKLGKEFFKEAYRDTYVYNPENFMYGWILKFEDENKERKDNLANIGLKIYCEMATNPMFEIR